MINQFFGYDLVDGKWVINETEADLLRFVAAKSAGENPQAPYHMVKSIMKYHNDDISVRKAQKLAHEEKYINMYYRALCREKYIRETGHEPPKKDQITSKKPSVAFEEKHEPIIDQDTFNAVQEVLEAQKVEEFDVDGERWLDLEEISTHLCICKETVVKWIKTKALPGYKAGRGWRFKISEVDAWVASGTRKQITFQKLFRLLKDRGLTRKELCEMTGLSQATLTKVGSDLNINSSVLDKICLALGCKVGDIVSIVPADLDDADNA